jgi:hypothetical protein
MTSWSIPRIQQYYDAHNVSLLDLSRITGYTIAELKRLIML